MAALIRIVNAFYAALFVLAALVSLGFLTAALDGLGRGPEAVWISCAWAALMTGLAILCFFNMRRAGQAAGARCSPPISPPCCSLWRNSGREVRWCAGSRGCRCCPSRSPSPRWRCHAADIMLKAILTPTP